MDVNCVSSNKKKKKNHGNQPQKNKNTAPANTNIPATADPDIPVQSLSEMLAFAHEAESKMEDSDKKNDVIEVSVPLPKDIENIKKQAKAEKSNTEQKAKAAQTKPEDNADKKSMPSEAKPAEKTESKPEAPESKPEKDKASSDPVTESPQAAVSKSPSPEIAQSGPPLTAEETARQVAAEDALDRDLQNARRKKLKEEAYLKHQRDMEIQKEAERLERAEKVKQRQINAAEAAKKLEAAKSERLTQEEFNSGTNAPEKEVIKAPLKNAANKYFNKELFSMAAMRTIAIVLVVVIIAYGGAFIYTNSLNDEFYAELETKLSGQSRMVSDSSIAYHTPEYSILTHKEKLDMGLNIGLIDSDSDGLSDSYEIDNSFTDPLNPDSDGDSVSDGIEIRTGLDPSNPCTDGTTPDKELIHDVLLYEETVHAQIKDLPVSSYTTLTKLDNNSIQGTPGIIGYAYELYSNKSFDECTITFSYTDKEVSQRRLNESALSVFRFDADSLTFKQVTSSLDMKKNKVSATVTEAGIYALCDNSILMQNVQMGKTKIFFLIDNSGSMYPEELCQGSEENDVEFKRLDFAMNLIDMLGVDAWYGAGEFSGSYSGIVPISDNYETVKNKISDIRNKKQIFSGTEIAGAISSAVREFGSTNSYDKNYIILLTDGMPSTYNPAKEKAAIEAARNANITIFTIGLGKYIDNVYLSDIADQTNGQFFQASNADALENIYEKIQNFMSYNQVTIEEDTNRKGYIIADSGFNVQKDGIGYSNFRADFVPNGADVGIAGLIRAYYTGELDLTAPGYTTDAGKQIKGYDISRIESFTDGKTDLKNVEISALSAYNEYASRSEKWDFKGAKNGILHYTTDTRDFIDSARLKVFTTGYDFTYPEESGFVSFLRTVTFNKIKAFESYECVLIDSSICEGDDAAIMDMLRWYSEVPNSEKKCRIYDFGYEGDAAFEALLSELTTGSPAVITYGGSAMNAVRIVRDANDPNQFVLDAYDSNSPDRSTRITITRTPIYDDGTVKYQYAASRGTVTEPLRIIVID